MIHVIGFVGFAGGVANRHRDADNVYLLGPALLAKGRHEVRMAGTLEASIA